MSSRPNIHPTKETANAPGQKQRFELRWLVRPQLVIAFERQPIERFASEHQRQEHRESKQRHSQQRHSQQRQPQQRQQPERRQRRE